MHDDSYYVKQVLKGNLDALDQLVYRYKDRIYRLILRMIHDPEEAKDLTQECFTLMYLKLESYDLNRKFSTWFYRIAVNRYINEIKKRKNDSSPMEDSSVFITENTPEKQLIDKKLIIFSVTPPNIHRLKC
ncbi:RNA polymerase sigma factor [Thermoflavimicrobium daqui]|uniref:RNA polymerase sigma-70 region 2 domain-containing protein n=1 Tax=Thermoflavimicrobium daqui TaxID=2137476 RepID=A0A364K0X2_9BACL|nr:sigma-70 family RNA polymerase sigma factor [Thermoflavimicrobium daqui]RAL21336.1 hypothetical protein DL897_17010 [Thermoflavimicrobium daqui]